ncbi:OmpA family protein [Lewinella sp. 4G2]|uniref:OmpA family protein n=1 Tax=Lewinella sp. 4G2 TaxID=1803372 RepID=UPI0007B48500|nr:OmpA family protein [Lewinella sp. 4G2]OAV45971.1 hypothetical protein A3850_018930 [Lewinella sp. 4G2]
MRLPLYLFLLLTLSSCATAQRGSNTFNKKETQQLAAARMDLDAQEWSAAIGKLNPLIEKQPDNEQLYYLRSLAKKGRRQYTAAAADIRKGISVTPDPKGRPYAELGSVLSLAGDFSGALDAYRQYLSYQETKGRSEQQLAKAKTLLRRAIIADSIARNPVDFSPAPVVGGVNTKESFEYHPTLSTDGQQLIFTRRVKKRQEDFYVSDRQPDGSWSEATPLPGINTEYDEGAQSVSADGNYFVYASCNQPGPREGCDLYESTRREGQFTAGTAIQSFGINTDYYESQPSLSADGRYLVFTSKRPGGTGGADLYISARLPDGGWSKPGPLTALNTEGNEQYPFWAADGRSLYFTSDGHPGLGGDDLFVTKLGADNRFSPPQNLGYPINTAANETNMFIPLEATEAYFSKRYYDETTEAIQIDVWSFPLPPHLRPRPATYVAAEVIEAETGQPLVAEVSIQALDDQALPQVRSTDERGRFLTVLPAGAEYAFTVDREGYLFASERFTVAEGRTANDPLLVKIALSKISEVETVETNETDGSIAFKNVLFTSGSADLLPVSFAELDRLAATLQSSPELRVELAGHTDDVGEETDNLELSQRRAAAVKEYLVREKMIEASRISTLGYGEARPVAGNDTPAGREQNRRTTFRLFR